MGLRISGSLGIVENNLERARKKAEVSLDRLSSGVKFTKQTPLPAERAQSEALLSRISELTAYKKNINDGISLFQFADSSLEQMRNMIIRMKEIRTTADNPSYSREDRQNTFHEYKSLYDEIERMATQTKYGGLKILSDGDNDITNAKVYIGSAYNLVQGERLSDFVGLNHPISSTPKALGLLDAQDLIDEEEGITVDEVDEYFSPRWYENKVSFDNALDKIAGYRVDLSSLQSRLFHVLDFISVANENLSAANARISHVDYAKELVNLTKANILIKASASLLSQAINPEDSILTLLKNVDKN